MRIADMNWMQVEAYLAEDDRCVLPVGSVEQHAQLSLCVDGNFGGAWRMPGDVMLAAWQVGVEETRRLLEAPWPAHAS